MRAFLAIFVSISAITARADYNVRDYGATGNDTTDDTVAIQAAIDDADTNGGGTVYFPNGAYKITGLVVGTLNTVANARSSNISIEGESELSAQIRYYGPSTGTAIRFNKNKYAHMQRFRLSNLSGRGSTTGIETSGPAVNGTESNGNVWEQLIVEGFSNGWHTSAGTGATGSTASEMTLINCSFQNCDHGIHSLNFNALNINLINCSFSSNTVGVFDYTSGFFVRGGSASGNGTDFSFHGSSTQSIVDFRSETSAQFISFSVGTASGHIFVSNCQTSSLTLTGLYFAAVYLSGVRAEFNACQIDGPIRLGNGGVLAPNLTDISLVDCKIKDTRPFYHPVRDGDGAHYRIRGCAIYSTSVNSPMPFPNSEGIMTPGGTYMDWINEPTNGSGVIIFPGALDASGFPTVDPHVANRVWNNAGVLTVSSG